MQHHVADGMSGIHCVNTWSEMVRGIPLKVHPFIDRTLLKANSPPTPKYPHIEYQDPPRLLNCDIVNCVGNGNRVVKGESYMNSNGHGVDGSHAANGKSNSSHVGNGESNGSHVGNGKSNGSHIENGKSNGSHVENGKSNGSHIENGKSNGSHVENGKINGSHIENGKSNGCHVENGKSNGSHVGNGKSNGANNGNSNGVSSGVYNENHNCNGEQKYAQLTLASAFHKLKEEDIPMAVRVFKFTPKQMATLKQIAVEAKTDVTFSSYEMLSGHIWKCVTQARNLQHSQETKLFIATDGRSRLVPPLPKGYFGNVIFTCTPIATAGELVANPVTYAARKVSAHTTCATVS